MSLVRPIWTGAALAALWGGPALAQSTPATSSPDFILNTLFMALCAILVMWMAAGFTMLETGFVRSKNVAMQCAKNLGLFAVASICFFLVGYNLMYPGDTWLVAGLIGTPLPTVLAGVATEGSPVAPGETAQGTAILYQMMFCAATASIVSGTLAERLRLLPFLVFTAILTALIYPIQASWSWGGGFLETNFGFKDLAGGTVVHVVGGVAALTGAIVIGARKGRFVDEGMPVPMPGSNLPLATLGAFILWMGWFGFTAGSYVGFSSDVDAANVSRILINTNMGAAGGVIAALVFSYVKYRQVDLTFMINGALAGLVSITAEPLYPSPLMAAMIGGIGGMIVVFAVPLIDRLKIDDVVGAIPVHLFCGIWGSLAVVISNPDATIVGQAASIAIVAGFVAVSSMVVWLTLKSVMRLRVASEHEDMGLDLSELGQEAYPEFAH